MVVGGGGGGAYSKLNDGQKWKHCFSSKEHPILFQIIVNNKLTSSQVL